MTTIQWILIIIGIVIVSMIVYTFYGYGKLYSNDAKQLIQTNCVGAVVDVRTTMEYNAGHYPNALHIPVTEIGMDTTEPLKAVMGSIIVYCNTGQRARYAAEQFRKYINNVVFYIPDTYTALL